MKQFRNDTEISEATITNMFKRIMQIESSVDIHDPLNE